MYQNNYQQPHQPSRQERPPETAPEKTFFEVVNFCQQMQLEAEVVGRWIWVSFERKPAQEVIKALKDFGFHWSHRRQRWAHNCGHESHPGKGDPREKYEHYPIAPEASEGRKPKFHSSDGRYQR